MKFLNGHSSLSTRQSLIDAFEGIKDKAASGHYLDRLIAITEATESLPQYVALLKASKAFMEDHHKAPGLDALTLETSEMVLSVAELAGLVAFDLRHIVWGIDLEALELRNLAYLRKSMPEGETP